MHVYLDRTLPRRGMTCPGRPNIFLRDGDRGTRMEQACAHELGHHHVWDQHREEPVLEKACNRFAACLMLPRDAFAHSVRELDGDPMALSRLWKFSSVELIARRIPEVASGFSSAAWLEFKTKWREGRALRNHERQELEAVSAAYLRPRGHGEAELPCGLLRVWRTGTGPRSAVSVLQAA